MFFHFWSWLLFYIPFIPDNSTYVNISSVLSENLVHFYCNLFLVHFCTGQPELSAVFHLSPIGRMIMKTSCLLFHIVGVGWWYVGLIKLQEMTHIGAVATGNTNLMSCGSGFTVVVLYYYS